MNIAVIGKGIVSAIGCSVGEVYDSLRKGRSGIGEIRHLPTVHKELPAGEVRASDDQMKSALGIPQDEEISRTALMGIMAVDQAVKGLDLQKEEGRRIVLLSGTTVAGMDLGEKYFLGHRDDSDALFMKHHDCGRSTQQTADHFGFFTDTVTISTACSSAANAIMVGAEMLRCGEADIVVAGGTEALSLFHLNGFNSLMIMDKERCRPFDAGRAGLNLGEGAGYIVLASEELARERENHIHAYLAGYGNACDAYHLTATSENGEGPFLSMTEALRMGGMKPSDIDYVNAHGTGTPNNDNSEAVALARVFGKEMPLFSSTKGFTGHTTSASGGIEAVIALMSIEKGFVPGNLGWSHPMGDGLVPTMGAEGIRVRNVLSNSFGFGGNDTSLIFSDSPARNQPAPDAVPDDDIVVLAKYEVSSEEGLSEIRNYMKPLEYRRMGKLMKAAMLSSLKVLEAAGIETPDAIVSATEYGCLQNTEILIRQMAEEGETALSPSAFMQSTHNSIAGNIAIRIHCHGYNITYSQAENSLDVAMADARRLIRSGRCRTVLVGLHDETTELFSSYLDKAGLPHVESVKSISFLLSCRI